MDQEVLNKYIDKGLSCPFVVLKSGEAYVSKSGEPIKDEISQMATVIFETIGAVGGIKVESLEMIGDSKGILIELDDEALAGNLFDTAENLALADLWTLVQDLKTQPVEVAARVEKPKVKVKVEAEILDKMKELLKNYLGDFTERVYKNQLKAQRINVDEFYDEDARRFIFALGKAAGMIIGPSKGRELTNKLLELLK
jgi:hypothetical protein